MKLIVLIPVFIFTTMMANGQHTISGYVHDAATGEVLIGVSVACQEEATGTVTNAYGYFALTLKKYGTVTLSYIGYEKQMVSVSATTQFPLVLKLKEEKNHLKEVVVKSKPEESPVFKNQTSVIRINIKEVSSVPVLAGERDIVKVLQLMPGVKRGSEGSTAMLVRGGSSDQNLILLDEAPVYNASHLLGFFSVFNSDALRDVTMQKGGFTANYGGRLSSVLDVKMKEGNMNDYHVEGGVGLLSSRLSVEGPILKQRMSFIVSGRRTYIDQVYKAIGKSLPFYFFDINAKVNYKVSDQDKIYLSTFYGRDVLQMDEDNSLGSTKKYDLNFGTAITNHTVTLRWNHIYASRKLFHNISLISSRFGYDLDNRIDTNSMKLSSSISDLMVKSDYDYYPDNRNRIKFGGELIRHHFRPNVSSVSGNFNEQIHSDGGLNMYTNEFAVYASDDIQLSAKTAIAVGGRLSGATTANKTYINPEPRFTLSYRINSKQVIKTSYTQMNQYMHLVSSSSAAMPSDLWFPVSDKIKPQHADQVSAEYSREFPLLGLTFTSEVYYKWLNNLAEYKEGTIAFLNNDIEKDLIQGKGKSYGLELLLHKKQGRFSGWVAYTLSWSTRQFEQLNKGETFYMRYDKRHDLSVVANIEITKRVAISSSWVFATGSRFTPVTGQYLIPNANYTNIDVLPIYSKRNEAVLSASHRLDLNLVLKSKPGKKYESEFHIGAYNVYNRTQAYRIKIMTDSQGKLQYQQLGLFGFVPSVAYHFKF